MYNIHGHTFTFDSVPENFIPMISKRIVDNPKKANRLEWILRHVNPFFDRDILDKFANFIETMGKSQYQIMQEWKACYPLATRFTPLAVDLTYMGAGKITLPYMEQLEELLAICKVDSDVKMFVMVDPRADYLGELETFILMNADYIAGIKLYPLVGYYVTDERLDPFYELCDTFGFGVTIHCTPKNAVYYRGKDIDSLLDKQSPFYYKARGNKKKAGNFAHPAHIMEIASKWETVNFNAAHFGGCKEWQNLIIEYIGKRNNIFTDVSFTYNKKSEQKDLKRILEDNPAIVDSVLFGDDYYMIKTQDSYNPFYEMRKRLGDELWDKISIDNPEMFLRRW